MIFKVDDNTYINMTLVERMTVEPAQAPNFNVCIYWQQDPKATIYYTGPLEDCQVAAGKLAARWSRNESVLDR